MALARYQTTIVDDSGDILSGATITVRSETPGAALAALYSDRAGTVAVGNPISSESDGSVAFHVANGAYRIDVEYGAWSRTYRYVGISTLSEASVPPLGVAFLYDSVITDADPGSGYFRLNNAVPADATALYINETDDAEVDVTDWLTRIDDYGSSADRGVIVMRTGDGTSELIATITGSVTDGGGYRKLVLADVIATSDFASGTRYGISFFPRGIDGANGADGEVLGPGATVEVGQFAVFADGTGTNISGAETAQGSPAAPLVAGTVAGVASATDGHVIEAGHLRTVSESVALSDAATVALDWTSAINFTLTITADRVIGNPTNGIPGTWRTILVQGDDGTARTITFDTEYLGDVPTITDCTNLVWYLLMVYCVATDHFVVSSKQAK